MSLERYAAGLGFILANWPLGPSARSPVNSVHPTDRTLTSGSGSETHRGVRSCDRGCPFAQGLGLLINLVEYSARNRHCLVEMELESSAPFDSVCLAEGEELRAEGSLSAIAVLVQVRIPP